MAPLGLARSPASNQNVVHRLSGSWGQRVMENRSIHVTHVIDALHTGGAERMLVEIANATPKDQIRVSVVATREGGTLASELHDEVRFLSFGRTKRFDLAALRHLGDFCRTEAVDVLHVHGRHSFRFLALAKLLGRLPRNLKVLLHDHYGDVELDPVPSRSLRFLIFLIQPRYVGVHPRLVEGVQTGLFSCREAQLINNAIDFRRYEAAEPDDQFEELQRPVGLMVANIRPTKDVLLLLRALARLVGLQWSMLLLGGLEGEYATQCVREADRLCIGSRVRFLGVSSGVPARLQSADFAVLCSLSEAGPLALLEYVAASKPFVSTRVGSIAEALEGMGLGVFVPPGDEEALAAAVEQLIRGDVDTHLVASRREVAKRTFDISNVICEWLQIYRELTEV